MGERKKISLTELDESSIVASFKEEQPAQAVPLAVEPETPVPRQTEQPDIKPAHESEYLRLFIHESRIAVQLRGQCVREAFCRLAGGHRARI